MMPLEEHSKMLSIAEQIGKIKGITKCALEHKIISPETALKRIGECVDIISKENER